MISVIVPFYNEEKILSGNFHLFLILSKQTELIFVDGGSTDRSADIAKNYGRVMRTQKGRAAQMNCGAIAAQGNILLFLHADNTIYLKTLVSIELQVKEKGFIGDCLTQRIDRGGIIYRLLEEQGNIRARMTKVFYGEQGIFVRKDVFLKMNGFPQVPI